MREFWVASGHHLTRRADHGGLVATPELIMAYLARPELMPPSDACDAERDLHASLMADPLRAVSAKDIARLADADARENWSFMMNFRDRLMAAPSLEAVYVALARKGAGDLPPIFLSQLCHLILRNALEGCDDPYILRAAELFYRARMQTLGWHSDDTFARLAKKKGHSSLRFDNRKGHEVVLDLSSAENGQGLTVVVVQTR